MTSFHVPPSIPKTICWHIDCGTAYDTNFYRLVITNHRVQRDMPETRVNGARETLKVPTWLSEAIPRTFDLQGVEI